MSSMRPKVLAVDDRYENLVAVDNVLSGLDLEVIRATSGEEALAQAMRHQFALVLLDVQMPGMDGFETATLLRANQDTRTIPIIFVTAISKDDEYAFRGYETGAVDFLFKPIDPAILRGKVKVFLSLFEHRTALEQEICHRKRVEEDLRSSRVAAESANRAKSEFLANMSHELRTPMNSIIGFTRRVLKKAKGTLDERSIDALETIDRNSHQLLDLINDILDMSKIEAGRMDLDATRFDALVDIRNVVQQLEPLVDSKPITIITEFPDSELFINSDRTKFCQIVRNLVSNAIKYTDEGTVTIRADLLPVAADSVSPGTNHQLDSLSRDQDQNETTTASAEDAPRRLPSLRIQVKDTGIGIKEADRVRLFDRFSQLEGATTRRFGGTGLGLYITASYIRMLQGTIDVGGQFGEGSLFTVVLPSAGLRA